MVLPRPSRLDLTGRVVLLTGGSAGIGRATLRRLSGAGAAVVACARDGDRLSGARSRWGHGPVTEPSRTGT
jgi:NADP-dependent 3-hydroxy acid dehydrogenase YdfG